MARSFLTSTLSSDESLTPPSSSDEGQGLHSPIYHRKKSTPKQRPFSPSSLSSTGNEDCHDDLEHGAWNTNYAVVYLINHLRKSSSKVDDKVTSAARAITLARNYPVPARQWRRYPGLIFPALSDAVFDSKLSDEQGVKVGWKRMDEGVSGRTVLLSQEVKIELNATALRSANRDEIIGTLLHHMIHAYLLVVCGGNDGDLAYCHEEEDRDGWEEGDENNDYDHLAHGHAFAAILWEIRSQAAKGEADGERPLPIGFGHRLPSAFSKFMTDRAAASCASASTQSSKSTGSMSSTSAIKSTKKGSNATTHSPRHPRNCSHCPACVPTISLDASETCRIAASDSDEDGEPEPTAHLFHDIRVYHLASALGFAELAAHSLRRLYVAQPFTYEDPLNLVEAIYFPGTGKMQRSHQLRAWRGSSDGTDFWSGEESKGMRCWRM
ncbi:hypothetical protein SLS56_005766 [Neofusicoccum ribis]|uniref:SprT-like domain-containing protein n=1 Tax=Neofusicoccum ribis TaxID=45134 RepID=A0ABR3SSU0_9PEZI